MIAVVDHCTRSPLDICQISWTQHRRSEDSTTQGTDGCSRHKSALEVRHECHSQRKIVYCRDEVNPVSQRVYVNSDGNHTCALLNQLSGRV